MNRTSVPSIPRTWEVLLRPESFHAIRFGSSTIAISLVCLLALAFFSIADYREVVFQDRENALNVAQSKQDQERTQFAQWLQEKERDFNRYLWITGELSSEQSDTPATQSAEVPSYDALRAGIERLENRIRVLSDFQARDEDYFWYVPSISPVALEEDFTLATGPLTMKEIRRGLSGVSSKHGVRVHPIDGKKEMHYGIDIFCPLDTKVRATANGTVLFVGQYSADEDNLRHSFGNFVTIGHGDTGIETLYAHLDKVLVRKGQVVHRGDAIASSGNTGSSTGPHVHYEVIRNGIKVNPLNYISDVPLVEAGKKIFYVKNRKAPSSKKLAWRSR
ncbi:MAG TPA: M23 family metallopeptidase [Bdellovibrionota bacterium]|nr:M23 family metallopeptidase [Bdellovibrionota bacterium]